jgi:transposase
MTRALAGPLRTEIVRRRRVGEAAPAIAAALNLKVNTVRAVWQRYRQGGAATLVPATARSGRPGPHFPPEVVAAALALKQAHPTWGAGLVRLELAAATPAQPLPGTRTLQRWWRRAGLQPARNRQAPHFHGRGQVPHEVWQLDAKERIVLADGSGHSVLTVVDEASGAVVAVVDFPPQALDVGALGNPPADVPAAVRRLGAAAADSGRSWPSVGLVE